MVQHAHNIFRVLGLSFSDFTPVYLDFAAGAEALAAGEVDAQFQCPIPNKVMTELSERAAVRVLPYAPGDLAALMKAVSFYRPMTMRKGAFRGLDSDIAQPAVVNVLATHARMSEAVVHEAIAADLANTEELGRLNSLFSGLDELFEPLRKQGPAALEFGGVKLHPGALSAYRQAGLLVARTYCSGIFASLMTLLQSAVSSAKNLAASVRVVAADVERQAMQLIGDFLAIEDFDHVVVELIGERRGGLRRCHQSEPGDGAEAGQPRLGDGRHFGHGASTAWCRRPRAS